MPQGQMESLGREEAPACFSRYSKDSDMVFAHGESLDILKECLDGFASLIITSLLYNIGKEYEKEVALSAYLSAMEPLLEQTARVLSPSA